MQRDDLRRPGIFIAEGAGLHLTAVSRVPCMMMPGLCTSCFITSLAELIVLAELVKEDNPSECERVDAFVEGINYACANGATFPVQFVPEENPDGGNT